MISLAWVGGAVIILIVTHVFWAGFLWQPYKNVRREQLAQFIRTLIRYYQDTASMLVIAKTSSAPLFRFCLVGTKGDGCIFKLEVLDSPLALAHKNEVLGEIRRHRYEPVVPDKSVSGNWPITVNIEIEDIWMVSAGNRAARLTNALLDVMRINKEVRFEISGPNSRLRSRERILEARRRQKKGFDLSS